MRSDAAHRTTFNRRSLPEPPVPSCPGLAPSARIISEDVRADGLKPRSLEALEWALGHVLEHLAAVPVNETFTLEPAVALHDSVWS